jgi:hypothetical protein
MRRLAFALVVVVAVALSVTALAVAFEGGGRKPSEAPLISYGQHYTGQLNNHESDANYEGREVVAFWRLPPVSTRDTVTVNWHELPYTGGSSFPVCMALVQGVDDFSWGAVFRSLGGAFECDDNGPAYRVSGSGSAQTAITVQSTDTSSSYLLFFARADEDNPTQLETYPYDFSVEPPRRFLGLALKKKKRVFANGAIAGAVTLADGLPAPDGVAFNLSVTWPGQGIANYAATTSGGRIVFPLALPESAVGEQATFIVTHAADASYQAASARFRANVKPAQASAADQACARAVGHAHAIARQLKRLRRNANRAHGQTRRSLKRKARKVRRQLKAAQAGVRASCPR